MAATEPELFLPAHGLPIGLAIAGAHRHDSQLVRPTLESVPIRRPKPTRKKPQHLYVDKAYLGDPVFHPFWEAIAAHGVTVWIHPEGTRDPWFQRYALWNSAGQSIEEAKCLTSLVYEGVMHEHPQLKVVIAHGGGYFPHYLGRMDRNTQNRPDTVQNIGGRNPSEFLRAFHYDTCVYDPNVLRVLVERVGVDRLVLGSDYPVGEQDPIGWLRDACGLNGAELAQVAGGNAARLLGLSARAAA
jgi:aminocarboxymuconate-semialdehyde decarboxylase